MPDKPIQDLTPLPLQDRIAAALGSKGGPSLAELQALLAEAQRDGLTSEIVNDLLSTISELEEQKAEQSDSASFRP